MYKSIFLFLILILCTPIFANSNIPIEIIKIYDGDTVQGKLETKNTIDIRLFGIDCYETTKIHKAYTQAYQDKITIEQVIEKGNYSKNYLAKLLKIQKQLLLNLLVLINTTEFLVYYILTI